MYKSTQQFIKALEENEWKYDVAEAESSEHSDQVQTGFEVKNCSTVTINLFFDDDDGPVHLRIFDLAKATGENADKVLKKLNELNSAYNFMRFYLDTDDNTVCVAADAAFCEEDLEDTCIGLMMHMINTSDEVYPELMKAMWS